MPDGVTPEVGKLRGNYKHFFYISPPVLRDKLYQMGSPFNVDITAFKVLPFTKGKDLGWVLIVNGNLFRITRCPPHLADSRA